jgi:hypothetical protein
MADVALFRARFPEFDDAVGYPDARIQLFLDDAALLMNEESKWLSFYDPAQSYYAAHLLVVGEATENGDVGVRAPVKKKEVDDVVIEKAISDISPTMSDLYSTSYGKRYLHYRKIILSGPVGV